MDTINRKCKYCGAYLKSEYIPRVGMCVYCDNNECMVKPMTDYNFASSPRFQMDLKGITDDWEGLSNETTIRLC